MGEKIKLFIGHYHLHTCGVTRIIQSQVASAIYLNKIDGIFILSSGDSDISQLNQKIIKNIGLNYLKMDISKNESFKIEKKMLAFVKNKVRKNDIIHFHNHNLGKNPILTIILFKLAEEGYKIVFHCHDFAEDREENYNFLKKIIHEYFSLDLKKTMYPDYQNCFYITLQKYDYKRLINYGLNKNRIKVIPNPVNFQDNIIMDKEESKKVLFNVFGIQDDFPVFLYPVRVIRRKNIGEFILLAALFQNEALWMITLPPKNPVEIIEYNKWKFFCDEYKIKIYFEINEKVDFITSMNASYKIVTTSIKEGFGMSFLEPWMFNKQVVGRDISIITKDFKKNNLKLNGLYKILNVLNNNRTKIDFAGLNIEEQMSLIKTILHDEKLKEYIINKNNLKKILFSDIDYDLIEHNKKIIKEKYSIKNFGNSLNEIYERLLK